MKLLGIIGTAAVCVVLCSCSEQPPADNPVAEAVDPDVRLAALAGFPVGVAVPADPWPNSLLQSPERKALVSRHFNSLTAENIMKMAYLQPAPGEFAFEHADALVDYARQQDMLVHGHALVWHRQAPDWMNEFDGGPEAFADMLDEHVREVAGHFAGRLESWDVVNEAFTDDDPADYRETIWYDNLGPEYIERAFHVARAADPDADLYYNDYDLSGAAGPAKLERILDMVDDFKARGVPIDGIGFQMHIDTERPDIADMRASFAKAVERGIKVRLSELDVSVNPSNRYTEFTAELAELQRRRYADVVGAYIDTVPPALRGGITVWGITDADSWIAAFDNRQDWPLLFDGNYRPKPALRGMAESLADAR
jgi:endo-1,4-beta-xylanase